MLLYFLLNSTNKALKYLISNDYRLSIIFYNKQDTITKFSTPNVTSLHHNSNKILSASIYTTNTICYHCADIRTQ